MNPQSNSPLRLSDLAQQIQRTITGVFGGQTYWIIADVSSHNYKAQTNYHYFELVEKDSTSSKILAKIAGRAWGNASVNISNFEHATGQKFKNDINVLVQVSVQYNPSFGLQLNLLDIDVNFTLGQFEQQRKATLLRLLKENADFIQKSGDVYHTRNSSLKLLPVLQKIAVISSDTSAGYLDFRHTLEHNAFGYKFIIDDYFTPVQGEANAKALLDKLIAVYQSGKNYDALVLIRGGGAQTDFLIFDNYELNRAIARFPIPVITGIGHQQNETIADLMAHTATKTPTKAAEFLIAHNRAFEDAVINHQKNILIKTQQLFALHSKNLSGIKSLVVKDVLTLLHAHQHSLLQLSGVLVANPKITISNKKKDLSNLAANLKTYQRIYFSNKKGYLGHYAAIVKLMSPQNILNKGFAILKVDDKIASDASLIEPGTELTIQLAATELKTTVKSKKTI
ncbi:exodeoxyribonuclease VII large subunit [Pedobacter sp. MC2016-14]|uniref:exodeoxyribonuclease VII large subunit n=1 Tax=Pedobacter sp. MC2016-14 TaxID=2897327 RepID=UPI001E4E4300|nr:exodeoxyribonuclease VII large subunit [Pedobacter sp. MC2016-14]MCD0489758.1 exodeoxyribonuclease VII large subunit [Pedobacter sp. MC2016-14]